MHQQVKTSVLVAEMDLISDVRKKRTTLKTFTTDQPSVVQQFAQRCTENIDLKHLNLFLIFTWISFVFYVLDIVIEFFWVIKFYNEENEYFFRLNLIIFMFPCMHMKLRSALVYTNDIASENDPRDYLPEESDFRWIMKWLGPFRLRAVSRYWDTIKCARKAKQIKEENDDKTNIYLAAMIWEDAEILQLHEFDCLMETSLQILTNLYVIVTNGSHFGVFSVICLIISVLSLSWAIISYNQKIGVIEGIKNPDDADQQNPSTIIVDFQSNDTIDCITNTNWKKSVILFLAHVSFMVGRIFIFSSFASVYGWIVWPACLAHLIPIFVWHRTKNYSFTDSLRFSVLHVITYLIPAEKESDKEKHPRISPAVYQTVLGCENLFLMLLVANSYISSDEELISRSAFVLSSPGNQ